RSPHLMRRVAALFLLVVLAAALAGCGSRADDSAAGGSGLEDGGGDDGGGDGGDEPDAGRGDDLTPASETLGDLPNPCSGDAAEGDLPADTPGVSDDTIRIGVISDRENPAVPLPTVGIEEATRAFVEF